MKKNTVNIVTLGCSKNLVDSQKLMRQLTAGGYNVKADTNEPSDVVIINTCGFIESAKQESIDTILEMAEYKNSGSCKLLIASGSMAERYKEELMKELPELDAVIGTGDYKDIVEVVEKALSGEKIVRYGHQEIVDIDRLPRRISTFGAS